MAVRTRRIAAGLIASGGGDTTLYTCPADRTAIVKDLRVRSFASGGEGFVYIELAGGGTWTIAQWTFSSVTSWVPPSPPWVVLQEGDELHLFTTAAAGLVTCYASGTELAGDPS